MEKNLNRIFPLREIKNVSMYYLLSAVYNMWFVAGIWVFIWGRFMSKTEMGISDAITFTIGFLLELPSGVIADVVGRKKAILLGNIMLAAGNMGVAFSGSFWSLTGWYLLWTSGYAFQSGATEALTYDSVKLAGKEDQWNKVIGTAAIITRVTSMTANVIGGLLFSVWFRLPYIVFALTGIIGVIAAAKLVEIPVKLSGNIWSPSLYLKQIKDGVSVLLKPNVRLLALISLTVAALAYIYNWGLLRPLTAERFGYGPVTLPLLQGAVSIVVIATTITLIRNKHRYAVKQLLFAAAGVYAILFVIMAGNFNWIAGGLIMISISVCSAIVDQLFSQFINEHTKSEHRATTLSATSLLIKLPYVALAIILGILAEKKMLPHFTLVAGVVAGIIWLASIINYRREAGKMVLR